MPPVIDKHSELSLTFEDFDPPLKRKEPSLPGYWTLEEISKEIGTTTRKIVYDARFI